jgi:hypothetical protein
VLPDQSSKVCTIDALCRATLHCHACLLLKGAPTATHGWPARAGSFIDVCVDVGGHGAVQAVRPAAPDAPHSASAAALPGRWPRPQDCTAAAGRRTVGFRPEAAIRHRGAAAAVPAAQPGEATLPSIRRTWGGFSISLCLIGSSSRICGHAARWITTTLPMQVSLVGPLVRTFDGTAPPWLQFARQVTALTLRCTTGAVQHVCGCMCTPERWSRGGVP